jgi:phosphoglycolate phosphatase-like HAD superfamily hydrolase
MRHALEAVFGTAGAIDTYRFGGSCDRYTIFKLMQEAGVSQHAIEHAFPTLGERMASYLHTHGQRHGIQALPGGQALYNAVMQHPAILLGIVTGNFEESGRAKLRIAGYADDAIITGAYGSESADRADLPQFAQQRARALIGEDIPAGHITVIGDTTSDIACARAVGARVVAVSTGSDDWQTLQAAQPDLLIDTLEKRDTILDFVLA